MQPGTVIRRFNRNMQISVVYMVLSVAIGVFILSWFERADEFTAAVMLRPYAFAVQCMYNIKTVFISDIGYVASNGAFVIGRDCMGLRFTTMLFSMLVCLFTHRFHGFHKSIWFICTFLASILVSLFITSLRILGSIPFTSLKAFVPLHTAIGAAFYIFAILGCYIAAKKLTGAIYNEKTNSINKNRSMCHTLTNTANHLSDI